MGNYNQEFFKIGDYFNASLYNANSPLLSTSSLDNLTNTILYSTDASVQLGTITNGKLICYKNQHSNATKIINRFRNSINSIENR